jgi:hypothetical protein
LIDFPEAKLKKIGAAPGGSKITNNVTKAWVPKVSAESVSASCI